MNVRVRAPVRIDFAGGWSDVPFFADEHGGAVVNVAITHYVVVEAEPNTGHFEVTSEDLGQTVTCQDADFTYDGTLDLHKAALNMIPVAGGVRLRSSSQVPPGSGLGTSGALDVALVAALMRCAGENELPPSDLAERAFHLEARELGLLGGRQDQYVSAIGGWLLLEFSGGGVHVSPVDVPRVFADELRDGMVLVYTGQTHFSSATHERVWARFHDGAPDVLDALSTLRDLAEPTAAALRAGDIRTLARLVDENWSQQQRLHPSIATPVTHAVEQAAREAGAWGAKATGAGAGGCMIVVGDPSARTAIENAVRRAGGRVLDYQFAMRGAQTF